MRDLPAGRHCGAGILITDRNTGVAVCLLDDFEHTVEKAILLNDCKLVSETETVMDDEMPSLVDVEILLSTSTRTYVTLEFAYHKSWGVTETKDVDGSTVLRTLVSEPFALFNKHRLGSKGHEVTLDNECSILFAEKEWRIAVLAIIAASGVVVREGCRKRR